MLHGRVGGETRRDAWSPAEGPARMASWPRGGRAVAVELSALRGGHDGEGRDDDVKGQAQQQAWAAAGKGELDGGRWQRRRKLGVRVRDQMAMRNSVACTAMEENIESLFT